MSGGYLVHLCRFSSISLSAIYYSAFYEPSKKHDNNLFNNYITIFKILNTKYNKDNLYQQNSLFPLDQKLFIIRTTSTVRYRGRSNFRTKQRWLLFTFLFLCTNISKICISVVTQNNLNRRS